MQYINVILVATTYDNYVARTAQQRDPPTAASADGDHVYPHTFVSLLRATRHCTRSFESIGESLKRQETKTKTGVAHTAENTSMYYLLLATFSNKPRSPPQLLKPLRGSPKRPATRVP